MRISEIKPQVKNKNRVSIFLDGTYYCGLELITTLKHRIKEGMEISKEELISIQKESELEKAYEYSLNYISRSMKTKKAVQKKLKEKGYLDEISDVVIERLENSGLIDDKDYALRYYNSYREKKGVRLIKQELKQKGVSDLDIEEALGDISEDFESCVENARKYMKNRSFDYTETNKCFRHLVSKGYSFDDIKKAIDVCKKERT